MLAGDLGKGHTMGWWRPVPSSPLPGATDKMKAKNAEAGVGARRDLAAARLLPGDSV